MRIPRVKPWRKSQTCIDSCCHYQITDDLIELAEKDEYHLALQKGVRNPTTLNLNKRHDFIGSLAQNGVFRYVRALGFALEDETPYFDATINQDRYDYMNRGAIYDVQGAPMGEFEDGRKIEVVYPNTRFLIKNEKEEKEMDYYTFCKVDVENGIVHIAGVISYNKFWDELDQEGEETYKHPCHYCRAKDLTSFRDSILG